MNIQLIWMYGMLVLPFQVYYYDICKYYFGGVESFIVNISSVWNIFRSVGGGDPANEAWPYKLVERLEKYHPRINDTSKNETFKGAWQNVTVCTLFRSCSEITPYRYTNRSCGKECYLVTNHCPWIAVPQVKDDFEARHGTSNGNSIDSFFCLWMYRIQITLFLLVQIFFWRGFCISFESLMFIFLYFCL